jgi:hypothetical protein
LARAVVNQPVDTSTRPILTDVSQLRPGATITVVAPNLPSRPAHDALFILQGPGYRGERLVQVRSGVAAALIRLPTTVSTGTWVLASEDLSGLVISSQNQLSGDVVLDLGIFDVGRG